MEMTMFTEQAFGRARLLSLATALALLVGTTVATAQVPSLCASSERTVWSCRTSKKLFSVCASLDVSPTSGTLQYRAGEAGTVGFRYPADMSPPKGHFVYDLLPRGARLRFQNAGVGYDIIESIAGGAVIVVSRPRKDPVTVPCQEATDTLTENATIDLFRTLGIYE